MRSTLKTNIPAVSRRTIERIAALASSVVASMTIRWPFSSPRFARTPSTQLNTARWVPISINRRVRDIVEWSGALSSNPMPTKRRNASESASRHAIPRSAPMPSKYPISSELCRSRRGCLKELESSVLCAASARPIEICLRLRFFTHGLRPRLSFARLE